MNIYISIDGVLRNFINRFHYHYENAYIDVDVEASEDKFDYKVIEPITNLDLSNHFLFQSKEQKDFFQYIEYPMELYGHSPVSYNNVYNELNKFVYDYKDHNVTIIGLDELGKARPATFFFLSRSGFMVNNIKFILTKDLEKEWENVDVWISDSEKILQHKPKDKEFILFKTQYNQHFTYEKTINKLSDINIDGNNILIDINKNEKLITDGGIL
jgi:hypothetical protein